jgi:threonyl-tRNA synthetase
MKNKTDIEKIRHSLAHLLAAAVMEMFPKANLGVGPVVENGFYYDFLLPRPLTPEDLKKLEKRMRELVKQKLTFVREEMSLAEAKKLFKAAGQTFKVELLSDLEKFGTTAAKKDELAATDLDLTKKTDKVSIYRTGKFVDLCRGPHVADASEIPNDAFKLDRTSGAYWRGDQKNSQLQRVYGLAFESKEALDKYLWQVEEAKKRDHRVLGQSLQLFTFADEVGPGLPLWMPKGTVLRDTIEEYAKRVEKAWGYQRVSTPHIAKEDLYKMSGHIPYYADSMYPPMKLDDGNYYLKAMNCPHTHMIYRSQLHSYRELPLRYAEYGTVYRYELSGTLAGLLRVRGFTQNDAHIYCREDQAEEEFLKVMRLHEFWYKKVFGIADFYMRLSLPAKDKKKYADIPAGWKKSVEIIRRAMKRSGLPFEEAEGEAAFYGPKVDFQIKSVIGREESASTNQLDFLATERFNLTYTDKDGGQKPVYVVHRAPLGSHERFIAFLIEHYGGAFPVWLSPVQATILPISEKQNAYAKKTAAELGKLMPDLRLEIDDRNESVGKKIREATMQKIPYLLVVGEKEAASGEVAPRTREGKDLGAMKLAAFAKKVEKEILPPEIE